MQLPADFITISNHPPVSSGSVKALVDLHQDQYIWPDQMGVIVHHILTADILGNDAFVRYVGRELKVPVGNSPQVVKMLVRDRIKLSTVVDLHYSPHSVCASCKLFCFLMVTRPMLLTAVIEPSTRPA